MQGTNHAYTKFWKSKGVVYTSPQPINHNTTKSKKMCSPICYKMWLESNVFGSFFLEICPWENSHACITEYYLDQSHYWFSWTCDTESSVKIWFHRQKPIWWSTEMLIFIRVSTTLVELLSNKGRCKDALGFAIWYT